MVSDGKQRGALGRNKVGIAIDTDFKKNGAAWAARFIGWKIYFLPARIFAQRAFCAAAIRARPAAESFRRFFRPAVVAFFDDGEAPCPKIAATFWRREISVLMA